MRQVLTDAVQNKGCTHFDARQSTLEYSIRNDRSQMSLLKRSEDSVAKPYTIHKIPINDAGISICV